MIGSSRRAAASLLGIARDASDSGIAPRNQAYYVSGMRTISLKLPDPVLARLKEAARTRRTTQSSVVRECLEKGLEPGASASEPSCYDLARDLAGSLKGLPRDLATNPKYLDGLGR